MPSDQRMSGRCLCGDVRFSVVRTTNNVGVCHCSMCRRWSSGPIFAWHCDAPVSFEGEENIGRYQSSEWGERGFCKRCGTNLFYRLTQTDEYVMSVGAFDDQSGFVFESEIFIDEKPQFYSFANDTKKMTGAEAFALFAPGSETEPAPEKK